MKEKELKSINVINDDTINTNDTNDNNNNTNDTIDIKSLASMITKTKTINNNKKTTNNDNDNSNNNNPLDDTTSAEKIQNLLNQQKTLLSKELEEEKRSQDILALELSDLTNVLKEATLSMHQSVHQQNIQLDQIQHHAVENVEELERQKKKMTEREKVMKTSIWGTFGSVIWVVVIFIITYIVIRFVPKPR